MALKIESDCLFYEPYIEVLHTVIDTLEGPDRENSTPGGILGPTSHATTYFKVFARMESILKRYMERPSDCEPSTSYLLGKDDDQDPDNRGSKKKERPRPSHRSYFTT